MRLSQTVRLVGSPVGHSLSPTLHAAAYAALGLDWPFESYDVPAGGLAAHLRGCSPAVRGLAVTAPLKAEALALADWADRVATAAGGANTLVRADGGSGSGSWHAWNTDVAGLQAALSAGVGEGAQGGAPDRSVERRTDMPLGLLGGGTTATSAVLAALHSGLVQPGDTVSVASRAGARPDLVRCLREHELVLVERSLSDGPPPAHVVVAAVPAWAQEPLVRGWAQTRRAAPPVLVETAYAPWPSPFARWVQTMGGAVVDGLVMLVHQAVPQILALTGREVDAAVLWAALDVPHRGRS